MIIAANAMQIAQKMLNIYKKGQFRSFVIFFAFQSITVATVRFGQMRPGPQDGTP